jgi:hypothetical protein
MKSKAVETAVLNRAKTSCSVHPTDEGLGQTEIDALARRGLVRHRPGGAWRLTAAGRDLLLHGAIAARGGAAAADDARDLAVLRGLARRVRLHNPATDHVRALLARHPGGLTSGEIYAALVARGDAVDRDWVAATLRNLVRDGAAACAGLRPYRMWYPTAASAATPPVDHAAADPSRSGEPARG